MRDSKRPTASFEWFIRRGATWGFGDGGVYRFDRPNRGGAPMRVARQPDGKLVVTGNAPGAFVARLNAP